MQENCHSTPEVYDEIVGNAVSNLISICQKYRYDWCPDGEEPFEHDSMLHVGVDFGIPEGLWGTFFVPLTEESRQCSGSPEWLDHVTALEVYTEPVPEGKQPNWPEVRQFAVLKGSDGIWKITRDPEWARIPATDYEIELFLNVFSGKAIPLNS